MHSQRPGSEATAWRHTYTHTHTCTRMHKVYLRLPLQRMHIITAACMPSSHSAQDARRPHGATNIHTYTNILEVYQGYYHGTYTSLLLHECNLITASEKRGDDMATHIHTHTRIHKVYWGFYYDKYTSRFLHS